MTNIFYTYEKNHTQPHPDMAGAMSWFRDYDVTKIVEVEYDGFGNLIFAWDRTSQAIYANDLAAVMKAARDSL